MAGFEIFDNNFGAVLAGRTPRASIITLEGTVFDGTGTPLRDVLVEIWQANAGGRYNHPADQGAGPLDAEFRGGAVAAPTSPAV